MNNYYNPYYSTVKNENRNQTDSHYKSDDTMTSFPENCALAMAYVPFQNSNETYDAEKALCQGTLFPVLDKPFVGC